MLTFESILWIVCFIAATGLMFMMVWRLVCFQDLEEDHLNPIDLCRKLNQLVVPEYAVQGALCLLFAVQGEWLALAWNLPIVLLHGYQVANGQHLLDSTSIFNNIRAQKNQSLGKLAWYVIAFFYFLYRMIHALVHQALGPSRKALSKVAGLQRL